MTAAVVCAVNIPAITADSGVIIDRDCSGTENGYSYEYRNNDKESTPVLELSSNASFDCSWDNKESFFSARGLKFAEPVPFRELGSMSVTYWRMIQSEKYSDDKGYVRFGIRLHNSKGDIFTILETDDSADKLSIADKDESLKKLVQVTGSETIIGNSSGSPVHYTLYSGTDEEQHASCICRRDTPLEINNESDDFREVNVSDILDAMSEAGCQPGEITDISLFIESAYSTGSATIITDNIYLENMPELAPDEYSEGDILVRGRGNGSRDGYYYDLRTKYDNGEMTVVSPSLFKAKLNSDDADSFRPDIFERGYKAGEGQGVDHIMGTSVDYEMNIEAEGSYFVGPHLHLDDPDTEEYFHKTDVYIVDASVNWKVPEDAEYMTTARESDKTYSLYHADRALIGTGKETREDIYYFVYTGAENAGKNSTISVKHEMAPFIAELYDFNDRLCEFFDAPFMLGVQLCAEKNTVGSAELVRNDILLPEKPRENSIYDYLFKRIDLNNDNHETSAANTSINGQKYEAFGYTVYMNGYTDEPIKCKWNSYDKTGEDDPYPGEKNNSFSVRKGYGTYSIIDRTGCLSYYGKDELVLDYSVDIGNIRYKTDRSDLHLRTFVQCMRDKSEPANTDSPYEAVLNDASGVRYIVILDHWDNSPDTFDEGPDFGYRDYYPDIDLGMITSNGVTYYAKLKASKSPDNYTYVQLTRFQTLPPTKAEDVPEDHVRYENELDLSDIMRRLKAIGIDFGGISEAEFLISAYDTEGSAILNRTDFKSYILENRTYTEEEIRNFSDFLLGKAPRIDRGFNYDLNGDGVWDTYDLSLMKSRLATKEK